MLFVLYLRNLCNPRSLKYFLVFSSVSFLVFALTFKSMIHLKLILVNDELRLDVYIFPNGYPMVPTPVVGDFFPFPNELP